jgi:hypothetical protein
MPSTPSARGTATQVRLDLPGSPATSRLRLVATPHSRSVDSARSCHAPLRLRLPPRADSARSPGRYRYFARLATSTSRPRRSPPTSPLHPRLDGSTAVRDHRDSVRRLGPAAPTRLDIVALRPLRRADSRDPHAARDFVTLVDSSAAPTTSATPSTPCLPTLNSCRRPRRLSLPLKPPPPEPRRLLHVGTPTRPVPARLVARMVPGRRTATRSRGPLPSGPDSPAHVRNPRSHHCLLVPRHSSPMRLLSSSSSPGTCSSSSSLAQPPLPPTTALRH